MHLRKVLNTEILSKKYIDFEEFLSELGFMITVQEELYSSTSDCNIKFVTFIYEFDVFWQTKAVISVNKNDNFELYMENLNIDMYSTPQILAV